jgi:hypothetical protein
MAKLFFLFGSSAVEYLQEHEGLDEDKLTRYMKKNLDYGLSNHDTEKDPVTELLNESMGWDDYTLITEELYIKLLNNFIK